MTANVVLWPKVFVLSLSKKRFDSLTSQQQGWVREAAAQAVKASANASYDDSTIAQSLCITGVRFYDASAAQIAALRSKVRPVLDKLAMTTFRRRATPCDPGDSKAPPHTRAAKRSRRLPVRRLRANKLDRDDTHHRIETSRRCVSGGDLGSRCHRRRLRQLRRDFGDNHDPRKARNLHLELPAAGRPGQGLRELGGREPVFAGDLRGSGNTVWFVYRPDLTAKLTGCLLPASGTLAGHCLPGDPYRLTWSLKGNTLLRTDLYAGWPNESTGDLDHWRAADHRYLLAESHAFQAAVVAIACSAVLTWICVYGERSPDV